MRKNIWLILCVVTLMLSSCVVGPDSFVLIFTSEPSPTPVPSSTRDYSGYVDVLKEYYSPGVSQELFEYPDIRTITVISIEDLIADSWLLGWVLEATLNDWSGFAGDLSPDDEYFPFLVWLYANGFAASELRCAEGRHELGELIKSYAAKVREKRPDTLFHHMVVANTLWKQLPEGEANCGDYLEGLSAEEFMAAVVDGELQFGIAEEDR